jgi:DNA-binding NarL/FixJ family response regulator
MSPEAADRNANSSSSRADPRVKTAHERHDTEPVLAPGRVLIVEDDRLVALDLETMLVEFGFSLCTTACSAEQALSAARASTPDVVLMDIRLEGETDGVDAALMLRAQLGLRVVYLTANSDLSTVARAKLSEPYGYLLKPIRPLDLRCCLELALHQARLEQSARKQASSAPVRAPRIADESTKRIELLSGREIEVLTLVARGHTSKDIARTLHIAKPTVDTYRSRLVEKLGIRSRTEIVSVASKAGLLDPPTFTEPGRPTQGPK